MPPSLRLFIWKLRIDKLPVGSFRFGISDGSCGFCGLQESAEHLFFDCARSKEIWQQMGRLWDHYVWPGSLTDFLNLILAPLTYLPRFQIAKLD